MKIPLHAITYLSGVFLFRFDVRERIIVINDQRKSCKREKFQERETLTIRARWCSNDVSLSRECASVLRWKCSFLKVVIDGGIDVGSFKFSTGHCA